MKRILFVILDVLLLIIFCLFIFKGVQIGKTRILSFQGIANSNQELTQAISEAEQENTKYNKQLETIDNDVKQLTKAKKEYLDLMTVSTDSEIQEALQTKTYSIEYLWSQVGNYATKEGVKTKMELSSSSLGDNEYRNLNFTITGNYLAITNFISDIENDSNLDFTIDNFDMTGGGGAEKSTQETCTFVVRDVKIKKENTTVTTETSQSRTDTQENGRESNANGNTNENRDNNSNNNNDNNNNNNNNSDNNRNNQNESQENNGQNTNS